MQRWLLEAMGFSIQIMPLPEVYLAIQQGAVSGQENPIDTIHANKFYEVAPYVTLTNHVYSPIPLTISEKTWQKLSPGGPRGASRARRKEAADWSRKEVRGGRGSASSPTCRARARRSGVPNLAPFREAVQPAYVKAKEKYGADVDAVLAEADAVRKADAGEVAVASDDAVAGAGSITRVRRRGGHAARRAARAARARVVRRRRRLDRRRRSARR